MLVVQLSDMHVSLPGRMFGKHVDSRTMFERTISRVLKLNPAPDFVLLTGDLAETGAEAEYDFIAEHLARLHCPVMAIPGNHDVRELMLEKLPDNVQHQVSGHLNFDDDRLALRLIGLDTTIPDAVPGELCERRLAWLREALAKPNAKPVLLAMHHPPFKTGISVMDGYGIREGLDQFRKVVAEHKDKLSLIVCGHAHRAMTTSLAGVPIMMAPSSSFPFALDLCQPGSLNFVKEPAQFLVHAFQEDTGIVSHAVFVDDFPGPFALG